MKILIAEGTLGLQLSNCLCLEKKILLANMRSDGVEECSITTTQGKIDQIFSYFCEVNKVSI